MSPNLTTATATVFTTVGTRPELGLATHWDAGSFASPSDTDSNGFRRHAIRVVEELALGLLGTREERTAPATKK